LHPVEFREMHARNGRLIQEIMRRNGTHERIAKDRIRKNAARYVEAAAIYVEHVKVHGSAMGVNKAVAVKMGITESRAERWLVVARKRGLMRWESQGA
jgi:hypothetical protein